MFEEKALNSEVSKLRRFARRLTKNRNAADDLVESTLAHALEKRMSFKTGRNLFAWTSKIMFKQFASQYRHKKRFESQHTPKSYISAFSGSDAQEANTNLAKVRESMRQMTPYHREILVLVSIRGMGYAEVSEMLQLPVCTVRSRLSLARKELQDLLDAPQMQLTAREEYHRVFPHGMPSETTYLN